MFFEIEMHLSLFMHLKKFKKNHILHFCFEIVQILCFEH